MQEYKFKFFISRVEELEAAYGLTEKTAFVDTRILYGEQEIYNGSIRVRFNDHGTFPNPADIMAAVPQNSLRKLLAAEAKRYVKPQRRWL
ncbi:hypothetical protein [Bacillus infantis]|jgi:hypothetical protein|uniref:hypothetical protein n=1 Tax=Bacillus infantis TaxID=324767 RepID=UPI00209CF373|nr:hypothetical protein [Bacillus infantis]MCP1159151.1 hypothetical protein [Bacillus infantis]